VLQTSDSDAVVYSGQSVTENGVVESSTNVSSRPVDAIDSSLNMQVETQDGIERNLGSVEIQSTDKQLSAGSDVPSTFSAVETAVVLQNDNEPAKNINLESGLAAGSGSKQLIRVSADSVVTESSSRSSWFWSKKSSEHNTRTNTTSDASTSPKSNVSAGDKPTPKFSRRHKQSGRNESLGVVATDHQAGLADSSVAGKGDGSLRSSDVENSIPAGVQDHAQFSSKHWPADNPTTSTPVREKAGKERRMETQLARQSSSPASGTRPSADVMSSSPLSYAFILPETSIRSSSTATATHTSSFTSTRSELISVSHDSLSTPAASRQTSAAVDVVFDEGRYEMLLREKAGLEGRLEVMERENSEMLHQQAELKQRAAMYEQQIKTFMSISEAAGADRSAMAVDLETLRQNRTRLETVIVDAHKLLEEKEQEVQTLARDVELARLAGEKHLERLANVRREAASRDATVRDLKAKITELYVQSQTSDQSRQVLEGELAAVRADVAALTEAKEWYANQLRATQKDRTRLQQEAATARAETITANVASERLRAENARVKRNLAEVEQRVLTEKQTLARHLEDIEADMLAREAALTVQLRQAKESANHSALATSSHDETEELSCLKAELQRNAERIETVERENVELSRRLALSQQCVIDRDELIKSLERDRETAELRAEAAEQSLTLRSADLQQLELERSELQLQLDSASRERTVIDQSLQTLRRDTAVLETSFRRMQHDLAAKTAEVERLSSLRPHGSEEQLSEMWPDVEAAAGLKMSRAALRSAVDGPVLSQITYADKEIQSDEFTDGVDGSLPQTLQESVSLVSTDTQTEESIVAVVTETAEQMLRVDDVVLQSEVIRPALETSVTATAGVDSRILEQPLKQSADVEAHLIAELSNKSHIIDELNEELGHIKACLSKTQLQLDAANRHRLALESAVRSTDLSKEGNVAVQSLVLNTQDDSFRISSISDMTPHRSGDVAQVHKTSREVQLQTDEVGSHGDDKLQQQLELLETKLTSLQQELDSAVNEKLELETAKALVEQEARATAARLCEVEKLLQQTQDDLLRLEQQLSDADRNSLEMHNSAVQQLETEKLTLQSQLTELTQTHHKDVSRLKSKVCCYRCL